MNKVLVTIPPGDVKSTFLPPHLCAFLEENFDVTYNDTTEQYTPDELRALLPGFDAVITGWRTPMLDESVLAHADRLKMIAHTGGSVGNLVDSFAYEKGIRVFSGNRLFAESVAEGTIAYMLMAQRRIPKYLADVREGRWRGEAEVWEGLLDKTVGIVGMGTISSLLIPMLQPFRVKILTYSHHPVSEALKEKYGVREASLEELFAASDIVTVHSALNSENRGLVRKEHFDLLKDNALFINTSRGDIIDEAAMIEALRENRFRAVLDVYHEEPLPADSPLRSLPNVYALPHMTGPTLDRREHISRALIGEMIRFFNGETGFDLEITQQAAKRMTKM